MQSPSYPFKCGFFKLVNTFDIKVISQCQYYSGCLPFSYQNDLQCLKFYCKLSRLHYSPAGIMFHWFRASERDIITTKYNISAADTCKQYDLKIWTHLQNVCGI